MCAIAGILDLSCDAAIAKRILATMVHRGPDGSGCCDFPGCVLLHTRLAIIDPEGGGQPMQLQWGQERYTITYNGELYNTQQLRDQLLQEGHSFLGHSDTEVVLHAYAHWGQDCVNRFNGIFAFAVWEHGTKRLFLARDRMGVKPLFYKLHEGGLLFASEMKSILAYPTVRAQLDTEGIGQLLLLGPGRLPGSGVFKDVQELKPGCCAVYTAGRLRTRCYWRLRDREHTDSFAATVEKVRELVTDSIKRQMVSDVPLGTFLSGGLDSSLISAVCAREYSNRGMQLDTFSVDYENNERYFCPNKFQPDADAGYIRIMANTLHSRQHSTVLSAETLVESLEDATRARDLPGMADVDSSLLAFCADIRKSVKVAISGECADEIFGGYPWYRDPAIREAEGFPWAQNTRQRSAFLHPEHLQKLEPEEFVRACYQQTIAQTDVLPGTSAQERRLKEMVNLNQCWFMQTLLDRKDRMSMYHGLEVRVPFCDYRIAEYLYGVPWEFKDWQGREKGLLRIAMEGILPQQILHRKKSPYPKTYDPKYLQLVKSRLEQVLSDPTAPLLQLVDRHALSALLTLEQPWPWYGQLMRMPQTVAYMLQLDFWLREYRVSIV